MNIHGGTEPVRCLILAHAFNMDGRAASQTIDDKIPILIEHGWKLFVLSAITGARDTRFPHRQLVALGPAALRFDFRHWLSARIGKGLLYRVCTALVSLLVLPLIVLERIALGLSSQWSWALPATLVGYWWIRRHRINLIYSTGGAWSAHLAGKWLRQLTGVRWIVEFHDPMVDRTGPNDIGDATPATREARARLSLESAACRLAEHVWWFTRGALEFAIRRHPALGDRGFHVLPGAQPPPAAAPYVHGSILSIAHFGSLSESRSLSEVLSALPAFLERHPEAREVIRFDVYGSDLDRAAQDVIAARKLQDFVRPRGRIEYDPSSGLSGRAQVFRYMQTSDFLLLLHGNHEGCAEYIPSKLYEYWWARRPVLAVTHRNTEMDELVDRINTPYTLRASAGDSASILQMLEHAWELWRCGRTDEFMPPTPLSVKDAVDCIVAKVHPSGNG